MIHPEAVTKNSNIAWAILIGSVAITVVTFYVTFQTLKVNNLAMKYYKREGIK